MLTHKNNRTKEDEADMKLTNRLAIIECNKILQVRPDHVDAALLRLKLVTNVNPIQAINMLQAELLCETLPEVAVRLLLGTALETAKRYNEAWDEYKLMLPLAKTGIVRKFGLDQMHSIFGMVRCAYHSGSYRPVAIITSKPHVQILRHVPGAHRLVASTLLAMEKKGQTFDTTDFQFPPTLEGAIEVMYCGFMYEPQWIVTNKQANRMFLEQLLAQQQQRQKAEIEAATATATVAIVA